VEFKQTSSELAQHLYGLLPQHPQWGSNCSNYCPAIYVSPHMMSTIYWQR